MKETKSIIGDWKKLRKIATTYMEELPNYYQHDKDKIISIGEYAKKIKPLKDKLHDRFNFPKEEFIVILWAVWGLRKGKKRMNDAVEYGMEQYNKFKEWRKK
jgi:hypothetical protein